MRSTTSEDDYPVEKPALYGRLLSELKSLTEGERNFLANAANCAALLYGALPNVNWAGFYFVNGQDLVLGPFQGKPACVRIAPGRGVCGTAAAQRQTIVVADVHRFPGHIACDAASNSEIVVPVVKGERLIGVLDIDSPLLGRFDQDDAEGLLAIVEALLAASETS
ncbi:MAG: GAF domain-containing protein [Planctomycetia bacterium]|nr:GAF domain-containing protein [Planctomycetia bacterium]